MEPLVQCINDFVRGHLPHLSYKSIALVHGVGRAPMNLHTHGHDDCDLTGEITIGDFDGGYLFTTGYFGGGGSQGPCMGTLGGATRMGMLGRCKSLRPPQCISFAWTYALAWGRQCYCKLQECIVGTLDARRATRTP